MKNHGKIIIQKITITIEKQQRKLRKKVFSSCEKLKKNKKKYGKKEVTFPFKLNRATNET